MQPLSELTLTRPWHWGVAVLGDMSADVPGGLDGQVVAVGEGVVAIGVRHAQDIHADTFEDDWNWATATFHLRVLTEAEPIERRVLCDFVVDTPDERIGLGDADGEVVIAAPSVRTRVIVSADEVDQTGLDRVWVDLLPDVEDDSA